MFCTIHKLQMKRFKIFVRNLNRKTRSKDLKCLFQRYGIVNQCDILSNYAFVVSLLMCI